MWNYVPINFSNDPEKILTSGFFLRGKTREESRKCAMLQCPNEHGPSNSDANGDSSMAWLLTEGHMKTEVSTVARDSWERHQGKEGQ